jgi:hypothetical protein
MNLLRLPRFRISRTYRRHGFLPSPLGECVMLLLETARAFRKRLTIACIRAGVDGRRSPSDEGSGRSSLAVNLPPHPTDAPTAPCTFVYFKYDI